MNKNTNDLRHSNRQITWGCFPLQCYLAGSWTVLFPAACYICRSSAPFLFWLPGQLSILPLSSSCQARSACRRAGRSFLPFSYKPCAPLTGSPFLSSVLFVLLSVCMFSVPSGLVSELADCKVIMLIREAATRDFPPFSDSLPVRQLPGRCTQGYRMRG